MLEGYQYCPSAQGKMDWNGQPFSGFHTSQNANAFTLQSIICLRGTIGEQFKRVRGFGGLQEGSGQTPKNGLNGPKSPYLGVCPDSPWRPPNPLTLLNCSPIVPLKHMIDWRQYCINALLKNNNEIMQYYIISNDIALIMHCHALLQMPDWDPWKYFKVTLE